ncbi:MAG: hypothetical protein WBZ36_10230 [Candidatus Nitrosopolaris sp.]
MTTQVSIFGIIAAAAVLVLAGSQVVTIHKTFAATTSTPSTPSTPIVVNPPTTIVNQCPLGTIPESTTTGTVCLLIPNSGDGFGNGFGHGFGHHFR